MSGNYRWRNHSKIRNIDPDLENDTIVPLIPSTKEEKSYGKDNMMRKLSVPTSSVTTRRTNLSSSKLYTFIIQLIARIEKLEFNMAVLKLTVICHHLSCTVHRALDRRCSLESSASKSSISHQYTKRLDWCATDAQRASKILVRDSKCWSYFFVYHLSRWDVFSARLAR